MSLETKSATDRFNALVEARMQERKCPRNEAHAHICRQFPQLREEMVREANEARPRRR